ncbi:hypothetical protein OSB04_014234 [Centaurea solstitialis]|uniref:Uncharacterized protein n=1 Tax=Centaurea solstitialis TaxID=347529 RepID=A0AA38WHJ3_9ASTR|nr:hypothetical protein OSB04_014234 [Centaurea solstitialis]
MSIFRFVPGNIKDICLIISSFSLFYLLSHPLTAPISTAPTVISVVTPPPPTRIRHLLFSIASSNRSYNNRKPYLRLWYKPNFTNAVVFLDRPVTVSDLDFDLPPVVVSGDTSRFPYTYPRGLRSAIRVARIVKEAVNWNRNRTVLAEYDHERWFYVGGASESYEQNFRHSFGMAYGGGGFAISRSLARVLARVLDSCLMRYPHEYGSDSRVFSCLVELGVELTHHPGFHQVDVRGDISGILSAHPLPPLLSLHHLEAVDPIFPGLTRLEAVKHLFEAAKHDPARILQQTVCYDSSNSITVSVSWGYAVQVFEGNQFLPDLIQVEKTFGSWRRRENFFSSLHMFNIRDYREDPCKRPDMFFLEGVDPDMDRFHTSYKRHVSMNCSRSNVVRDLMDVKVFSRRLDADSEQMNTRRRQCCDILPPYNETMVIALRRCETDELIAMNP